MKATRKLLALLLALTMVLGFAAVAFADHDADITDHAFTAYKIFNAKSITTNTDGKNELEELTWAEGVPDALKTALINKYCPLVENADAINVAKEIAETDGKEFAQFVFSNLGTTPGVPFENGSALAIGYWLIVDTSDFLANTDPDKDENDKVYNLSVLKVSDPNATVTVTSKVSVPEVTKKIKEGDELVDANAVGIGKDVDYVITGTVSSAYAEFETYYYKFTDNLSKGLTLDVKDDGKPNVKVEVVNGEDRFDVTSSFVASKTQDDAGVTNMLVSCDDLKTIKKDDAAIVDKDSKIVLTYKATVNKDAVIVPSANINDVTLTYSNHPDKSGDGTPGTPNHPTGETPKKEVKTYVTQLTITKVDGNGQPLKGAEFTLEGTGFKAMNITGFEFVMATDGESVATPYYLLSDGHYTTTAPTDATKNYYNLENYGKVYKKVTLDGDNKDGAVNDTKYSVKAYVDDDGLLTFTGIGPGEYTLSESVVPAGYNKAADVSFKVSFAMVNGTTAGEKVPQFASDNAKVTVGNGEGDATLNELFTTVVNNSGVVLPETGGIGTTLFYVFGSILVVGAGILLVAKKRMGAAE